eukprot:Protomagalhaensia_sp_Gyna_25__562@NODE_1264_length_2003_cov_67_004073_g871_i1_p1_GENE_NODE_1264_length_2003_cov_67_004073_g871_i1NODE_1264_length_2003_cov_67_004073_g871_i1_p1_ORF_typecomplete_len322_score35_85APG6/PF04111_12/28APG6/PF04111_12/4_NODE_1264_length_2003_cov_67_004073_g871_i15371502
MGFHFSSEAPIKEGVFKLSSVLLAGGYAMRFNWKDILIERHWFDAENFDGKFVGGRTDDGYDLLIIRFKDGKVLKLQMRAGVGENMEKQAEKEFMDCFSWLKKFPKIYDILVRGVWEESITSVPSTSIWAMIRRHIANNGATAKNYSNQLWWQALKQALTYAKVCRQIGRGGSEEKWNQVIKELRTKLKQLDQEVTSQLSFDATQWLSYRFERVKTIDSTFVSLGLKAEEDWAQALKEWNERRCEYLEEFCFHSVTSKTADNMDQAKGNRDQCRDRLKPFQECSTLGTMSLLRTALFCFIGAWHRVRQDAGSLWEKGPIHN